MTLFLKSNCVAVNLRRISLALLGALLVELSTLPGARAEERRVVAYCAQDQDFAEAIFKEFERETGVKVAAVYDSESVKTVGLANRLLAERRHPQADLFWGNEELRTRQLAAQNVFRSPNGWAAFGYRSRRIVINTNALSPAAAPHSLLELTNAAWRGKVALAYPQFGTTATHFHALRQHWGEALWRAWCRALAANQPLLLDGNSVVVERVGKGDAAIGLTDSDDIAAGQGKGYPILPLPMTKETLLIPNTVAAVQPARRGAATERLFDYLQKPAVVERLVQARALEGRSAGEVTVPTLQVDWNPLLRDLDATTRELNEIFLR